MKIIHIITDLGDGGAEGVLLQQTQSDFEHLVISLKSPGKYGPILLEQGIRVETLGLGQLLNWPSGIKRLFWILKQPETAVVQTWLYHADLIGGLIARLAGRKNIIWNIRNNRLHKKALVTRLVAYFCKLTSHRIPEKIICCSHTAAQYHRDLGYKKPISVVANGFDSCRFKPDDRKRVEIREQLNLQNSFVFGTVARWDAQKDHDNLIQAIAKWKSKNPGELFKLLLIGKGCTSENTELEILIQQNALKNDIFLLGMRNDVHELLNALDLHILPSKSEAFPNVIAESMLTGIPSIATNVGDSKEIIGKAGWTCPPRSSDQLEKTITDAYETLKNEQSKKKYSRLAIEQIENNYSLETMRAAYIALWDQLGKKDP